MTVPRDRHVNEIVGKAPTPRILIAVHQGFSVRYLLQTDLLTRLCTSEADVDFLKGRVT